MTTPPLAAQASRNAIHDYCDDIKQVASAKEPTLEEIREIASTCQMIIKESRRWLFAEHLIMAAPRTETPRLTGLADLMAPLNAAIERNLASVRRPA